MTLRAAEEHYRTEAALAALVRRRVLSLWSQVPVADVNAWQSIRPVALSVVTAGQYAAAREAEGYVARSLAEQGVTVPPEARVAPVGFAGMANGAAPVADLLDLPRITVLEAIGQGVSPAAALTLGSRQLETFALSLVQDAGRQADGVATFARPRVGWVRMVNPPCCERCAVLAGKWFKSNEGFQRHPRCDCRHIPAAEDAPDDVGTDPAALFDSGQVRGLREAEAKAIADGADPAQVINARRGAGRNGMSTTEGTTKRGQAYRAGVRGARPTPEAIYAGNPDRDAALEALRANGYIR